MTAAEIKLSLGARVGFIERYRPFLFSIEIAVLLAGIMFYWVGLLGVADFKPSTWGWWAWDVPAWAWWIINSIAAMITALGLIKPVKNCFVSIGAGVHLVQFIAISQSAFVSGGDIGVAICCAVIAVFPAKLMIEAVRWNK